MIDEWLEAVVIASYSKPKK